MKKYTVFMCVFCAVFSANITHASTDVFTIDLSVGAKGPEVRALQNVLIDSGDLILPLDVVKGNFGPLTQKALINWQTKNGITPARGFFGQKSRQVANATYGPDSEKLVFTIGSETVDCRIGYAGTTQQCLVVNGNMFRHSIQGFDYKKGYVYEIEVEKIKVPYFADAIKGLIADDVTYHDYVLVKVLDKFKYNSKEKKTNVVSGRILLRQGNCMPHPAIEGMTENDYCSHGGDGISRDIYVYKSVPKDRDGEYVEDGIVYKPSSKVVAKTVSDKDGKFSVNLPSGEYSLFIKDSEGNLVCPNSDGNSVACSIISTKSSLQKESIFVIDHAAY